MGSPFSADSTNDIGGLGILDLDQDVLLTILSFCGISGVSSASQTCKYIRSLAVSRYVWLCLVLDLQSRMFLDVPSGQNLRELSTPELVTLAKHTVLGPDSWMPPYSLDRAISRHYFVKPSRSSQEIESARLLPGGRYVAITLKEYKLQIWDISENKIVWEYRNPQRLYPRKYIFAVDMLDHGQSAMILVVQPVLDQEIPRLQTVFADFVHLDLTTGTPSSLCNISLGVHKLNWFQAVSLATIRGDIAVVKIKKKFFLIHWKNQSCIILDEGVSYSHNIILTRDYIVETVRSTHFEIPKLIIRDIAALITLWKPASVPESWDSGSIIDVLPIVAEPVALPSPPETTTHGATTVHESPLGEGLYQVTVVSLTPYKTTILCYSLSSPRLSPSATLWRLKSSRTILNGAEFPLTAPFTSYAGHVGAWVNRDLVVLDLMHWTGPKEDGALVGIHTHPDAVEDYNSVCISAYSGAMVYATSWLVVIRYYH